MYIFLYGLKYGALNMPKIHEKNILSILMKGKIYILKIKPFNVLKDKHLS